MSKIDELKQDFSEVEFKLREASMELSEHTRKMMEAYDKYKELADLRDFLEFKLMELSK